MTNQSLQHLVGYLYLVVCTIGQYKVNMRYAVNRIQIPHRFGKRTKAFT